MRKNAGKSQPGEVDRGVKNAKNCQGNLEGLSFLPRMMAKSGKNANRCSGS